MNFVNRRSSGAERAPMPLGGLRLDELEPGACRYPTSGESVDTRFCGRSALRGKSWCARCDRRVHTGRRAADVEEIAELIKRSERR